jgi:hypothetical protein
MRPVKSVTFPSEPMESHESSWPASTNGYGTSSPVAVPDSDSGRPNATTSAPPPLRKARREKCVV